MKNERRKTPDVESFNDNILRIDLDDMRIDAMEQRIELALASIFNGSIWGGPPEDPSQPCDQFSCTGYWPAT